MHEGSHRRGVFVVLAALALQGCVRAGYVPDASADAAPPDGAVPAEVGRCSSDGWCWVFPLPDGSSLFGVWSSGPTDVWAVGATGAILHFDGSSWEHVPSGTEVTLDGVSGSGPADIWAAGQGGIVLHYGGTSWREVPSGTGDDLWGVWASGPQDAWAVGQSGTIIRFDGSGWARQASKTTDNLIHVHGTGPQDVWVVGQVDGSAGTILHWDGAGWTRAQASVGPLQGVWARQPPRKGANRRSPE